MNIEDLKVANISSSWMLTFGFNSNEGKVYFFTSRTHLKNFIQDFICPNIVLTLKTRSMFDHYEISKDK